MIKSSVDNLTMEKGIVELYKDKISNDPHHRLKSWEHCYIAFGNQENSIDYLALHLAFYLASWGMYRGSTTLLKKDYKVHHIVVELIKPLCLERESIKDLAEIQKLMGQISQKYEEVGIMASKTLQTKVLLGTLGCFPVIDRFFVDGWKLKNNSIPTDEDILDFAAINLSAIEDYQKTINLGVVYPPMKIVDMYFWQLGYDKYEKSKISKAAQ